MRLLTLLLLAAFALPVQAQEATTSAALYDWPLSAHTRRVPDRHWRGLDVLPFIERLSLTFAVADAGDVPDVSARLSWRMGSEGIKRGRRVPARAMPAGINMVAFVLRADVVQQGSRVAGLTLAVDSTRLPAGEILVLDPRASWDVLFDEVDAATARQIVEEGFTLENLQLVRAAFGVFDGRTSDASGPRRERVVSRGAYEAYPDVWVEVAWDLMWLFGNDPYPGRGSNRALTPRGATGRESARAERGSRGEKEDSKKDDKKDKSGELLPAAGMIGAALVAGAVVSGSAGYAIQADEPIGFASGFFRPAGGVVLQASANLPALGMEEGDESLTAQLIGFYGSARQPVQPAVGFGLRYHERQGDLKVDPAFTLGGMFRLGRASLLAGYELVGQRPSFGLFYSWKMR